MALTYLLDTNTFSYIAKGSSPAARAEFLKHSRDPDAVLYISVITEAEVRYGMAKRSLSRAQRSAIEGLFANLQILPWGSDEAAAYAQARAELEARGISVAALDLLIAAQAIAAGAVLVSGDKIFAQMDGLPATENWATDL
jgi:tRNA(fMet)-specific endonuclease VapC